MPEGVKAGLFHEGWAYHSGRVTSVSMTVPGGGLASLPSMRAKNLELMRFFTTTTVSLGLEGGGRGGCRHETNQNLFTLP